jgi:hypothetical protein
VSCCSWTVLVMLALVGHLIVLLCGMDLLDGFVYPLQVKLHLSEAGRYVEHHVPLDIPHHGL